MCKKSVKHESLVKIHQFQLSLRSVTAQYNIVSGSVKLHKNPFVSVVFATLLVFWTGVYVPVLKMVRCKQRWIQQCPTRLGKSRPEPVMYFARPPGLVSDFAFCSVEDCPYLLAISCSCQSAFPWHLLDVQTCVWLCRLNHENV
jgi:hypothetical protein